MIELRPQVIEKHGKKEYVILPYEDYLKIQEEPESYNDLRILREAKEQEGDSPGISLKEAKKELKIK